MTQYTGPESLFKGTEWDTTEPPMFSSDKESELNRKEAAHSYSYEGNRRWFLNLIQHKYREQLARNWDNFTSTKITTTRKGLRVSLIRAADKGGVEMAFWYLDPHNPDYGEIRAAFAEGTVEWKQYQF